MKVDLVACLSKTAIIILVFSLTPWPWSIPVCLFLTWGYQYLIALYYGVHVMPTMDTICFMGDEDIRVNIISFTMIEKLEYEKVRERIKTFMQDKAKLRWKIVEIWGDYYWKDTTIEESIDYVFQKIPKEVHNERDIEQIVNTDLNAQMPLDRPQWRMWYQENYQDKYSIVIYKAHHSLGDGVSCMNYHIGQGDTFDNSALIPIRKVSLMEKMIMRLTFIFFIPRLMIRFFAIKPDRNILHDGKRNLSGTKISATSTDILFKDIKAAAKNKNVTINDFITSCMATGLKQYF
jgi:NRPS condensation-like uncharacterized protein